jgi:hypothetical protein
MADSPPYPGTPRWVKVSGIVTIVLVVLVVILLHTGVIGRHGPGRHGPFGSQAGERGSPSRITEGHTPPGVPGGPTSRESGQ